MKIKFECKWGKNKYLNIYLIITVLIMFGAFWVGYELISGLSDASEIKKLFWGIILSIDTATAVALAFLAYFGYKDYAKGEDEIQIVLDVDGKEYRVDELKLLRKFFTRAEILGVLGMIQNDSTGRFDFKYLSDFEFLDQINDIQKGKKDKMIIKLNKDEFNKFFSKYFQGKGSYE